MGRHLDCITIREGCKMKIDLLPGLSRPTDCLQAAKCSPEIGIHVRTHMSLKTKWKDYTLEENQHIIPEAAMKVKVNHQIINFSNFPIAHLSKLAM